MKNIEEIVAHQLVKLTEPSLKILQRANTLNISQLKQAIQQTQQTSERLQKKQQRLVSLIWLLVGGIVGSLISLKGFAEAVKMLDLIAMVYMAPVTVIAMLLLPIVFLLAERNRRRQLDVELEREILLETLLKEVG